MKRLTLGPWTLTSIPYQSNKDGVQRVMVLMTETRPDRNGKPRTRRLAMHMDAHTFDHFVRDAAWDVMEATPERARCAFCGDILDPNDADNMLRAPGTPKAGRTDCGRCVRGMRRNSGD